MDYNDDHKVHAWEFEGYFVLRALRHAPLVLQGISLSLLLLLLLFLLSLSLLLSL